MIKKNYLNQIKLAASGKPCRKSSARSIETRFERFTGTAARHTGQLEWEQSHLSTQAAWNACLHALSCRISSPSPNTDKHTGHWSLLSAAEFLYLKPEANSILQLTSAVGAAVLRRNGFRGHLIAMKKVYDIIGIVMSATRPRTAASGDVYELWGWTVTDGGGAVELMVVKLVIATYWLSFWGCC